MQRGQHCLLESPTGSGKTLAWQRAEAGMALSLSLFISYESLVRKSRGRQRATAAGAHLSPSFVLSRFFFHPSVQQRGGGFLGDENIFSLQMSAQVYIGDL